MLSIVQENKKNDFEYKLQMLVGQVKNDQDHTELFNLILETYNNAIDSSIGVVIRPKKVC